MTQEFAMTVCRLLKITLLYCCKINGEKEDTYWFTFAETDFNLCLSITNRVQLDPG